MLRTHGPTPVHRAGRHAAVALAAVAVAAAGIGVAAPPASAGGSNSVTITMGASPAGTGALSQSGSFYPALSLDGRYLAFSDTQTAQVYVEDLLTGRSELVSRTPAGAPAGTFSQPVGVSADGNEVAFLTDATNLAPAPHTGVDLYVRNRSANTTTRVDIGTTNAVLPISDHEASMDSAGDEVAWTDLHGHVWARHLSPASTQAVDVTSAEVAENGTAYNSSISADGKHVVFTSDATNLVSGDTNVSADVFERNLATGTTIRASVGSNGTQLNGPSDLGSVDGDGQVVVFESGATNAAANDTNAVADVFAYDEASHVTRLESIAGSTPANHSSDDPVVSADGTTMVFRSNATNLAPGDTNGATDFFTRRLTSGSPAFADVSTAHVLANAGVKVSPVIDGDGQEVAFASTATNLVSTDTNVQPDVFVRRPETVGPHDSIADLVATCRTRFGAPGSDAADTALLSDGRVSIPHFIATLAHGAPWATDREPVTRLYTAFFEREPDLGGLDFWVHKHATGTNLGPIATSFAASSEFQHTYGSVDDGTFVTLVYANVLQRKPDAAGLAHWKAKLAGGMTRGALMVQFSESSEGKRVLARSVDPTLIGLAMLQAMPSKADFAAAESAFDKAGDEGVANYYLDSAAYLASI